MKLKMLDWLTRNEGETLAYFGDARLVKQLNGKIQLIGGSPADHTAAKEWISLCLHNAAVSFVSPPPGKHSPIARVLDCPSPRFPYDPRHADLLEQNPR